MSVDSAPRSPILPSRMSAFTFFGGQQRIFLPVVFLSSYFGNRRRITILDAVIVPTASVAGTRSHVPAPFKHSAKTNDCHHGMSPVESWQVVPSWHDQSPRFRGECPGRELVACWHKHHQYSDLDRRWGPLCGPGGSIPSPFVIFAPFLFSAATSSLPCLGWLILGMLLLSIFVHLAGRTGRPWGYPSGDVPGTSNVQRASSTHALQQNGELQWRVSREPPERSNEPWVSYPRLTSWACQWTASLER